ncbi:MAG: hypothetical protein HN909_07610, partial [Phycisphaerales bacterium]|nr:hypothetical protein [Phycisphaerales bacterium]
MNRMILLGCVLAIGLLAGCTNYPMEEKIQYGNAWHVSLSEAPRTYPPMVSRPMRVEVSLEEAWQMPIDLDYRFVWFTRTGSPARGSVAPSASGGWRTVRV